MIWYGYVFVPSLFVLIILFKLGEDKEVDAARDLTNQ